MGVTDELRGLIRAPAASEVDPGDLVARELSLDNVSDRLAAMENYETTGVEVVTTL